MNETTQRVILENQTSIMAALIVILAAIPYKDVTSSDVQVSTVMDLGDRIRTTQAQSDRLSGR